MKIAVTGGGGSIGRALAARADNHFELIAFPNRSELDLAGADAPIRAWIASRRPDAIIHLAGWRRGYEVDAAFRDNVAATYNLLAAAVATNDAIRIVVASSAAVYGNGRDTRPLRVSTERRPINLYGVSKALQEDVCALVRASSRADISIARIFNVVGVPGDTWSVLPSLIARICSASDGSTVPVANAQCTRDFVHIDDVCSALVRAATQSTVPPVFNVATEIGTTIASLAQRVVKALHRSVDLRLEDVGDATTIINSVGDPTESLAMGCTYRTISDHDIAELSARRSEV